MARPTCQATDRSSTNQKVSFDPLTNTVVRRPTVAVQIKKAPALRQTKKQSNWSEALQSGKDTEGDATKLWRARGATEVHHRGAAIGKRRRRGRNQAAASKGRQGGAPQRGVRSVTRTMCYRENSVQERVAGKSKTNQKHSKTNQHKTPKPPTFPEALVCAVLDLDASLSVRDYAPAPFGRQKRVRLNLRCPVGAGKVSWIGVRDVVREVVIACQRQPEPSRLGAAPYLRACRYFQKMGEDTK
jgi:hypothetical protein